jgi:HAD superfamily hydrolase (TIGR01509 family)
VTSKYYNIAHRLYLPCTVKTILWDLDGTLVDSFRFDLRVCSSILSLHANRDVSIPAQTLRNGFALSGADFWKYLFDAMEIGTGEAAVSKAHADWVYRRAVEAFPLNDGILEILQTARNMGVNMAVVSNNPEQEVAGIVRNSDISQYFDLVVGNDGSGRAKKPQPDSYLYAANALGVPAGDCAVIEDSVLGLQAGRASGAYVIGVASGAEDFEHLSGARLADDCYTGFSECYMRQDSGLAAGGGIRTAEPAMRDTLSGISATLGMSFDANWSNSNRYVFGNELGSFLKSLHPR